VRRARREWSYPQEVEDAFLLGCPQSVPLGGERACDSVPILFLLVLEYDTQRDIPQLKFCIV
jgi:hypothetical protein